MSVVCGGLAALLVAAPAAAQRTFVKGPWLQAVSDTGITVMWEDAGQGGLVRYRTADGVERTVDAGGAVYIDYGDDPNEAVDDQTLAKRVAGLLKYRPDIQFLIKGDRGVPYGRVVAAMAMLQGAGVESVGLVTEPPEN